MSLATVIVLLIAAGAVVAGGAAASDRRETRRRARAATDELLAGHDPAAATPHTVKASRLLTALVAMAALFGALGVGYAVAGRTDQADADRSDQAAANVQRCTTQVATAWRRAVAVLLVGYTGDDDVPSLKKAADELDLPASPAKIRAEGRARLVAALADDARLDPGDPDPICPFVVGDLARTPADPVNSATARLDTTTTTTTPGD